MNASKGMKISPKECTALTFCWLIEKIDLVMIVNPSPSFKADPGGGGVGNTGGERILKSALVNDLIVGKICFLKIERHFITYQSGNHRPQIDYVFYRKSFRREVTD